MSVPYLAQNPNVAHQFGIPLFFTADADSPISGVVMSAERSEPVEVTLFAIDDAGNTFGPLNLQLESNQRFEFTSEDLEAGNPELNLPGFGSGIGNWRLQIYSTGPLELESYVKELNGYKRSMIDEIDAVDAVWQITSFPPASTQNATHALRVVNPTGSVAYIEIRSSESNESQEETVEFQLAPFASTVLTTHDLESGHIALDGRLRGNLDTRQLSIQASTRIRVQHIAFARGGVSNLSHAANTTTLEGQFVPVWALSDNSKLQLTNNTTQATTVSLTLRDQTGSELAETDLIVQAGETTQLSMVDFKFGNRPLGLARVVDATGPWLFAAIESTAPIEVTSLTEFPPGLPGKLDLAIQLNANRSTTLSLDSNLPLATNHEWHLTNPTTELAHISLQFDAYQPKQVMDVQPFTSLVVKPTELSRDRNETSAQNAVPHLRVETDRTLLARLFAIDGPTVLNLTPRTARSIRITNDDDFVDPRQYFAENIYSQIVLERCTRCHIRGGASQNTRLVFVGDDEEDHQEKNYEILTSFFEEVDNGASYLLGKVRGVGHGGGMQFGVTTTEYQALERFIELYEEAKTRPVEPPLSTDNLLDHVVLESERRTLWRAALMLAGRLPTDDEYASLDGTKQSLRATVRGLLNGPGFREFLLRRANDRLQTDHRSSLLSPFDTYVDYTNKVHELVAESIAEGQAHNLDFWRNRMQFGVQRAPLELIAHVVENDLPYTEVLTADYVMANPFSAEAYGADTEFENATDPFEFKPSEILSYYRKCAGMDLQTTEFGPHYANPGPCTTDLPQAGILSSKAFLQRSQSTPTNRNRNRARSTYRHFLSEELEKSASRLMDQETAANLGIPAVEDAACAACHDRLDAVAGAFQDYGPEGDYLDAQGGLDALDAQYRENPGLAFAKQYPVSATTFADRQVWKFSEQLPAGDIALYINRILDDGDFSAELGIDSIVVETTDGTLVQEFEAESLLLAEDTVVPNEDCAAVLYDESDAAYGIRLRCPITTNIELPAAGEYVFKVQTWVYSQSGDSSDHPVYLVFVPEYFYRTGDVWYRDMAAPGFEGEDAPGEGSSLQWLAEQIVASDDFAKATVAFWWPALMGQEVEEHLPEDSHPNHEALVIGVEAQQQEVNRLATVFREGQSASTPYNLRDLLTEMVMSSWFRVGEVSADAAEEATIAAASIGSHRPLTSDEIASKTDAIFGVRWRREHTVSSLLDPAAYESDFLTDQEFGASLLIGGVDSGGSPDPTQRSTPLMSHVVQAHAAQVSCPIVLREFYLLDEDVRRVFTGLTLWDAPVDAFGTVQAIDADQDTTQTVSISGNLPVGEAELRLSFTNYDNETDDVSPVVYVSGMTVRKGDEEVLSLASSSTDDITLLGECATVNEGLVQFTCNGAVSITFPVDAAGTHSVEVNAWSDRTESWLPQLGVSAISKNAVDPEGGSSIKSKLAEIHSVMLGESLSTTSPEIQRRYELLISLFERNRDRELVRFDTAQACSYRDDYQFLVDASSNPIEMTSLDEHGNHTYTINEEALQAIQRQRHFDDPTGMASTWVGVLASMLMDYRYLHF